jgi:hypothetical protein
MMKKYVLGLVVLCVGINCKVPEAKTSSIDSSSTSERTRAKFEPADGEVLFFIGQDMGATGALDGYDQGYCDHFDVPAGFTVYTNLSPGGESYGFYAKGNDGLTEKANWGSGDCCAQCYLDDGDYQHSIMAIGLAMVGHDKRIAKGEHDQLIRELGAWIKAANRPVFLRIGYEFDGFDWNNYERKAYLGAWNRIQDILREMEVNNVAYVWQSKGTGSAQELLEDWYPGDDRVDWCGYSYFGSPDQEMINFARRHGKPLFIAEATPIYERDGMFYDTRLSDSKIARREWDRWFKPFFKTIHDNPDVVKAFSYINVNWAVQPMWITNPLFKHVDSRLQVSPYLSEQWRTEINHPRYLKPGDDLWADLGFIK